MNSLGLWTGPGGTKLFTCIFPSFYEPQYPNYEWNFWERTGSCQAFCPRFMNRPFWSQQNPTKGLFLGFMNGAGRDDTSSRFLTLEIRTIKRFPGNVQGATKCFWPRFMNKVAAVTRRLTNAEQRRNYGVRRTLEHTRDVVPVMSSLPMVYKGDSAVHWRECPGGCTVPMRAWSILGVEKHSQCHAVFWGRRRPV